MTESSFEGFINECKEDEPDRNEDYDNKDNKQAND